MTKLDGAVAVVTGGGSGIGRAACIALARHGCTVTVADIDAVRADHVAQEIVTAGGRAHGVVCDVTHDNAHTLLLDQILDSYGRVDIVMNNVGVIAAGQPEQIPLPEWLRVIDINLISVLRSNAVFVPHLLAQGHGHLVYTASSEGLFRAQGNMAPYSTTKAAVVALADAMWMQLSPNGIGVTLLVPGPVVTNIVEQIRVFGDPGPFAGPELPLIEADVVGEQVVDAIRSGRYVQYTHKELGQLATQAADDRQSFLQSQLDRMPADLLGQSL